MASGIWTPVSGAKAQSEAVDTVANNLANMNTQGFKKDLPTFKEYLSILEREPTPKEIPRGPIKDKEFYPLDGRDQSFVIQDATYTHFGQGGIQITNAPLDLALDGPGFFEVSTPKGVRYTRHGSFKLAMDGQLVTAEGYPVLSSQPGGLAIPALPANTAVQSGQGGPLTQGGVATEQGVTPDVIARMINLRDLGSRFSITEKGEIYAGEQLVAQLGIREFQDRNKLRKEGAQLFRNTDPLNALPAAQQTKVWQGKLETSNVNPVEELTGLIKAQRLFEHDLKAIQTYNELMQKEVNEVGKL